FEDASEVTTGEEKENSTLKTITDTLHDYHVVDTEALRKSLIDCLLKQKEISFDTETTSIEAIQAELVGMSFSYLAGEAYYVPVPANQQEAGKIVQEFAPIFENETIL